MGIPSAKHTILNYLMKILLWKLVYLKICIFNPNVSCLHIKSIYMRKQITNWIRKIHVFPNILSNRLLGKWLFYVLLHYLYENVIWISQRIWIVYNTQQLILRVVGIYLFGTIMLFTWSGCYVLRLTQFLSIWMQQ